MSDIGATQAALSLERVSVIYRSGVRRKRALHDVSFSVDPGTTFGLIGPNGAGKSTLLRCVVGLLRPDAGTVSLLGDSPAHPGTRGGLGYLPDHLGYTTSQTGLSYLRLHAGLARAGNAPEIRRVAESMGVTSFWHRPMREYSKGMLQRVGLAAASLKQPEVLILDEPTDGLDPQGLKQLRRLVLRHQQRGGAALISSHHLDEIGRVCDRVALLREGRIRSMATLRGEGAGRRYVVQFATTVDPNEFRALAFPFATVTELELDHAAFRLHEQGSPEVVLQHLVRAGIRVRSAQLEPVDLESLFESGDDDE